MKIKDVERINELLKAREVVRALIARAERAEAEDFELMIERGGDGSIKLSLEGSDSTHYQGYAVSRGFLEQLRSLALAELAARRGDVEGELNAMGVEVDE